MVDFRSKGTRFDPRPGHGDFLIVRDTKILNFENIAACEATVSCSSIILQRETFFFISLHLDKESILNWVYSLRKEFPLRGVNSFL